LAFLGEVNNLTSVGLEKLNASAGDFDKTSVEADLRAIYFYHFIIAMAGACFLVFSLFCMVD
jgi:hypothetical protein